MTDRELIYRLQGQNLTMMLALRALIRNHQDRQTFLSDFQRFFAESQVVRAAVSGQPSSPALEDAKSLYEVLCHTAETGA